MLHKTHAQAFSCFWCMWELQELWVALVLCTWHVLRSKICTVALAMIVLPQVKKGAVAVVKTL